MKEVMWHEGDVVRKLRQVAGWKLKDLAAKSGVDISVIHDLEIGRTKEAKRPTLAKLAGAFGLTLREFLDSVPPQPVRYNVVAKGEKAPDLRKRPGVATRAQADAIAAIVTKLQRLSPSWLDRVDTMVRDAAERAVEKRAGSK